MKYPRPRRSRYSSIVISGKPSSSSVEPLECRIAPAFSALIDLSSLDGMDGFKLTGVANDDNTGFAVSDAGDVNGDSFADVIIGASGVDGSGTNRGAAYVVFGKAGGFSGTLDLGALDGSDGFLLAGVADGDVTGSAVCAAGDVNGDGIGDLLIGAPNADAAGTNRGVAYVFLGHSGIFDPVFNLADIDGANGYTLIGANDGDLAARAAVHSAGDVNGDGIGDMIVGAIGADGDGFNRGAAYVVFGSAGSLHNNVFLGALNGNDGFQLSGVANSDYAGNFVGSAGDVNGDGFDDVIVSAISADIAGYTNNGAAYVVFGGTSFSPVLSLGALNGSNGFMVFGEADSDLAGRGLSGAGDVNGDGFDDVIVGAYLANAGPDHRGAAYVIFGKETGFPVQLPLAALDGSNGFKLTGEANSDEAGKSVSGVGDFNGDGIDDLLIGAYGANAGSYNGAAYVVFGKVGGFAANTNLSSLNGVNGFKLFGAAAGDQTGISVSGAGDVNGDGFADIIMGAPKVANGGTNRGAAYVFFGGPSTGMDVVLSSGALTISENPGSVSDANLTVELNGANIRITDPVNILNALNGVTRIDFHTVEIPLSSVVGLFTVDGGSGDDSLFVNYTPAGANPLPAAGLSFIGGSGDNTLSIGGGLNSFQVNITHTFTAANNGMISVDSTPIHYSGVADIVDTLSTINGTRVFNFTTSSETINVVSGLDPFDLETLTSSLGITIQFDPSTHLTINANDGDDTITIEGALLGGIRIDGQGGNDTIDLGNLVAGTIVSAAAETINPLPELIVGDSFITTGLVRFKPGGGLSYYVSSSGSLATSGTLHVSGAIDITGAALRIRTSLQGVPSAPITLIDIPGAASATGIFDGLPEGSPVPIVVADSETIPFVITYRGGDGNDVQLIANPILPVGVVNLALLNGTTGFRTFGGQNADQIGQNVTGVGDVNGDGVDDFIISAAGTDIGSTLDIGVCYVVFGKTGGLPGGINLATLDGSNGFTIAGGGDSDRLGFGTSKAGDINGDGIDDILVSPAREFALSGTPSYVIFGRSNFSPTVGIATLDGTNGFKIQITSGVERGSINSISAGDFNGDGIGDIVAAATNFNSPRAVYILFGHSPSLAYPAVVDLGGIAAAEGFTITSQSLPSIFASSVSGVGDINGDGIEDFAIGGGEAYVVFGSRGPVATFDTALLNGKNGFKILGIAGNISSAGDMNGDGIGDIVLRTGTGGCVIFGAAKGYKSTFDIAMLNGANGFTFASGVRNDGVGFSAAGVGDFNGDGFGDVILGAPFSELGSISVNNPPHVGVGYLIFGRSGAFSPVLELSTLNGTTGVKFINVINDLGGQVSAAGDVNGDGKDDIIFGAPFHDASNDGPGSAYVVYGSDDFHEIAESNKKGNEVKFTDTDGDLITITVSKGKISPDMLTFGPNGELFKVDLTIPGSTIKNGANLTFSVDKVPGGDGALNVGAIDATGLRLGKVKVTGNLGQIDIGSDAGKNALKSLTVASLGRITIILHPLGAIDPFTSDIIGGLPNLTINGNVNLAQINVDGSLGTMTVGGDALGTDIAVDGVVRKIAISGDMNLSRIYSTGHVEKLIVGGDLIGAGAFTPSQLQGLAALGYPVVASTTGGITFASTTYKAPSTGKIDVAGNMRGTGINSGDTGTVNTGGMINSSLVATRIKKVKVFEDGMISDDPDRPNVISVKTAFDELTVNGDVKNALILVGYTEDFATIDSDARVGKVLIKGSWTTSSLTVGVADFGRDGFGQGDRPIFTGLDGTGVDLTPRTVSKIGSIIIKGIAKGSNDSTDDFFGITAQQIGKAIIYNISAILGTAANPRGELTISEDFRIVEV